MKKSKPEILVNDHLTGKKKFKTVNIFLLVFYQKARSPSRLKRKKKSLVLDHTTFSEECKMLMTLDHHLTFSVHGNRGMVGITSEKRKRGC